MRFREKCYRREISLIGYKATRRSSFRFEVDWLESTGLVIARLTFRTKIVWRWRKIYETTKSFVWHLMATETRKSTSFDTHLPSPDSTPTHPFTPPSKPLNSNAIRTKYSVWQIRLQAFDYPTRRWAAHRVQANKHWLTSICNVQRATVTASPSIRSRVYWLAF